MIYGIEIDRAYLHTMAEYRDMDIKDITPEMMAKVAMQNKQKYQGDAAKRQAELKGNYGTGVCVLVRVYNATGEHIKLKHHADFRGHLGAEALDGSIPNGTWAVFIHTKTAGAAVGAAGAVVYQTAGDQTELFAGWQNPWQVMDRTYDSQVYVEVREPGHWWDKGIQSYMLHKLDSHNSQTSTDAQRGFTAYGSTGNETTAYIEYVFSKP